MDSLLVVGGDSGEPCRDDPSRRIIEPIRHMRLSDRSNREVGAIAGFAPRFFVPVDIASLAVFRICFGLLLYFDAVTYLVKGWVRGLFMEPLFHFTFYGFGWVKPWPGEGMIIHFWVMAIAALLIALGWFYRVAAVVFFICITHVFLVEASEYLNHLYLICLFSFLLIFVPAHRAWSLDALRKPAMRSDSVPSWALWLMRFQVAIPYFFGGVAKLNADWLRGEPLRMWLAARTDFPVIGRWFTEEWMVYLFSYSGLILDLAFVPLLLWKRSRLAAYLLVLGFNLINARLFNIGVFPWFMIAASLLFFPPEWPRFWRLRGNNGTSAPTSGPVSMNRSRWIAMISIMTYGAWQVLMPLRHFLYPGNVAWTEEGHYFSWRMKLRSKQAGTLFVVRDGATGEVWHVQPADYLTVRQEGKMSGHPDLIHQFAQYLAREYRAEGYRNIEVRVHAEARLNGRKAAVLIDPQANLAAEPRGLAHKRWIMPLKEP